MKGWGRDVILGTGTKHEKKNLLEDSQCPGRDLNPAPPPYKAQVKLLGLCVVEYHTTDCVLRIKTEDLCVQRSTEITLHQLFYIY